MQSLSGSFVDVKQTSFHFVRHLKSDDSDISDSRTLKSSVIPPGRVFADTDWLGLPGRGFADTRAPDPRPCRSFLVQVILIGNHTEKMSNNHEDEHGDELFLLWYSNQPDIYYCIKMWWIEIKAISNGTCSTLQKSSTCKFIDSSVPAQLTRPENCTTTGIAY